MAYSGPDRRGNSSSNDRRKSGEGKPPPGTVIDRRLGLDPRTRKETDPRKDRKSFVSDDDAGSGELNPTETGHSGLERRRGRGRRLSEFTKSAEEGEMTTEQFLFLMAIDAFKRGNDRMFPTWTDVLEVIRLLGYRKTMPTELNLPSAEDWLERSDAPANVRPDRWAERFGGSDPQGGPQVGQSAGPKSEAELTDEALEAFEEAFGPESDTGADFDADTEFDDDEFSEAA